jgi:signal recognition particle subunit SRP54
MAFESLSDKFQLIIKKLKGETRLSEKNMDDMLKEVRVALLEADVNFKVVKEFSNHVKEVAIGQKVFDKLNPGQMVVKIVHDELENLLGSDESKLQLSNNGPTVIMLVGLQGSGKTTTAGKLALLLKKKYGKKVLLCACDVYRPAAIEQLTTIGKQIGIDVFSLGTNVDPVIISEKALEKAKNEHYDVLIIDTAGRLQIDDKLMNELVNIKNNVNPNEILLLVDAMAGQDAVNVALSFNEKLKLTGVVISKLDGDARGGAALSIRKLTGVPIKFAGVGEKISDLDEFHPDRMADRILGMGDIMTLVEKAQSEMDEKEMKKSVNKMMEGQFGLDDMLSQLKQVQKLGSLGGLARLIPGMPKLTEEQKQKAEKEMRDTETIINSMTMEERRNPSILKNSRKVRIAKGSGMSNMDVNKVLKKYEQMKQASKMLNDYKKNGKIPPGMSGMGGF